MSSVLNSDSVTRLMGEFRRGDREAGGALADLFYPELRRLAAAKMKGERVEHTLQPTAWSMNCQFLESAEVQPGSGYAQPSASDARLFSVRFFGLVHA